VRNSMSRPLSRLLSLLLLLLLTGCSVFQNFFALVSPSPAPSSHMRESVLERVGSPVRNELERLAGPLQATVLTAHETVETNSARFKRRLALAALKHPWEGLADLERQGLLIAEIAEGGPINLPALLDILEAGMDRTSSFHKAVPLPSGTTSAELLRFMIDSLEEASNLRDKALANLTDEDQHFLFAHAAKLVEQFSPQISNLSDQTIPYIKANLRFTELLDEQVDYSALIAAAQVLARFANERWLHQVMTAFPKPVPAAQVPHGVTGDVVLVQNTSYGMIVVGGPGPNTYELDGRFGLVIDLGGNDLYRGTIAASASEEQGNAVVIDLSGNDTYDGTPLGLATGRLGVGLLIDHAGDDVYQLERGSGGAGFGGLGILFDGKGNDVYMGNRLTQGAAIGGLGLLLDSAGNDRYTSYGFAIGFGGPLGVGAVVDVAGDDHYQCGDKYPSAYNAEDAPNGKPSDPLFQYDCFGLGTGSGQRILTKRLEWQALNLAGGWGVLLDIEGHDHYQSANFSQGHGYFFGTGVKIDFNGDDDHQAARYGHGASAHFGAALFIDRHGEDHYGSSGPFYNGGVAWDYSVGLMVDGGDGRDTYAFDRSTGLGQAAYSGWGLFIDEGGADRYEAKSGFGSASEKSLAGFFDLNGLDSYTLGPDPKRSAYYLPKDEVTLVYPKGGVFVDR
jgi:hypothetical protein